MNRTDNEAPATCRRVVSSRDAGMPPVRKSPHKTGKTTFRNTTVQFAHLEGKLSHTQSSSIFVLAKQAYKAHKVQGVSLDEWRQEQCREAAGVRLSEARGKHYPALRAHFEHLLGRIDKGLEWQAKAPESVQRAASLIELIKEQLCKLPPLPSEADQPPPPEGTPRASAWAWADKIATNRFGAPCRQLDDNALGTLHAMIKKEVGSKRQRAKALGVELPKKKSAPRAARPVPELAPCERCGARDVLCNTITVDEQMPSIRCRNCGRMLEGEIFAKILKKWNRLLVEGGTRA